MNEELITITQKEYDELIRASNKLLALEASGVDNWQGYDDAMDVFNEMKD